MILKFINDSVTNGEHSKLMHNAYYAIEVISDSLRRANSIATLKELYALGKITEELYVNSLIDLMKNEGFELK